MGDKWMAPPPKTVLFLRRCNLDAHKKDKKSR
jgi:hypothetical protein